MPQKRDKKLSKRALRRQESGTVTTPSGSNLRPLSMSAPAHSWPVHECLVPESWTTPGEMITLVVARRSEAGEYAAAIFLIDLGCLGVKNAYTARLTDEAGYADWIAGLPAMTPWQVIDIDLAAKIVRTAIDYAGSLGFRPHRDYALAAPYLRNAEPENAEVDVPTGKDGKPFFINGPYDNVEKIVAQLDRKVGPGNYHVMLGGPDASLLLDDLIPLDELEDGRP